ncbi:hypothetical protein LFX15_18260 [Leptospira levettii]|uniref:hypothetical protein n=1 Tax=Leptospira levettii TaxID=2023178 RepID=UPI001EEABEE9|nr:hypothetical protein [Leptospira levettii]MCG6150247.1 hypothetical protein [Leptospira levettii]
MSKVSENLKTLEEKKYYNPQKWILSFLFGFHRITLKDSAIAILFGLFLIPAIYGCGKGATIREKLANSFMLFLIAGIIHLIEGMRFKKIIKSNIINQLKQKDFFPEANEVEEIKLDIDQKLTDYIKSNKLFNFIFQRISKSNLNFFFINLSFLSIIFTIVIGSIFGQLDLIKREAKAKELETIYLAELNKLKLELNNKNKDQDAILKSISSIDLARLRAINNDLTQSEFELMKNTLIKEYKLARESITKKDWLRSQFDPKHKYLIYIATMLENISVNKDTTNTSDYLKNAILLTPAGNVEEAIAFCKRNIDRIYLNITYEDSFLLRTLAGKAVGDIVGDENNEKYTKFVWKDSIIGKNAFGVDIRNGIYCEVIFEKKLNSKNQLNYSEQLNKLLVGNTRIK